jgi:hypothetical protein
MTRAGGQAPIMAVSRVEREHRLEVRDGFCCTITCDEHPAEIRVDHGRERVQLARHLDLGECFFMPAAGHEQVRVPDPRQRVAGIQLDGAAEAGLRLRETPVVMARIRERRVRFRGEWVDLQRAHGRGHGARPVLARRARADHHRAELVVAVGECSVRRRPRRIQLDGPLEVCHGLVQRCGRPAVPLEATTKIFLVRFRVDGAYRGEPALRIRTQRQPYGGGNAAGEIGFEREDVRYVALEAVRPDHVSGRPCDEARLDDNALGIAGDAPDYDGIDTEPARRRAGCRVVCCCYRSRRSRDQAYRHRSAELCDQSVGDAGGNDLSLAVALVLERQHCERDHGGSAGRADALDHPRRGGSRGRQADHDDCGPRHGSRPRRNEVPPDEEPRPPPTNGFERVENGGRHA